MPIVLFKVHHSDIHRPSPEAPIWFGDLKPTFIRISKGWITVFLSITQAA